MKLWTIQPIEVYEEIEEKGYYICDIEKARERNEYFDICFLDAYNWLIEKMVEKIGKPSDEIKYPVWAWHTYDWKRKSSDLRVRQGTRGQKMVRMEIDIPDNEVVLSDFDAWHNVLNKWCDLDCNNEEEYDREYEKFEKLSPEEQKRVTIESWNKIFDLTPIDTDWNKNGKYIQATFWKLEEKHIKKVHFFKSK
jgi:hypothetical protein